MTWIASADFWPAYRAYLTSSAWAPKRALVLERDGHACVVCGSIANIVHHLTYASVFHEPLRDLVSICSADHCALHRQMPRTA